MPQNFEEKVKALSRMVTHMAKYSYSDFSFDSLVFGLLHGCVDVDIRAAAVAVIHYNSTMITSAEKLVEQRTRILMKLHTSTGETS
jgi:hypothetical protein